MMSKREFLKSATGVAAAAAGAMATTSEVRASVAPAAGEEPLLGQGAFRYRVLRGWGQLDQLTVAMADGTRRAAQPNDVTHIRWAFQKPIPAGEKKPAPAWA